MIEIAWVAGGMGDPAASLKYYDDALAMFGEISSDEGRGETLDYRCNVLTGMGELSRAAEDCRQALQIYRRLGNKFMLSRTLTDVGDIAILQDRLDDGRTAYAEALATGKQADLGEPILTCDLGFSTVALEQGRFEEANQLLTNAFDYLHAHEEPNMEISAESRLATLALKEGRVSDAQAAIERARKLVRPGQAFEERYIFNIADARVDTATGKLSQARRILEAAIADSGKHNYVHYQLEARLALCEVEAKGEPAAAQLHAKALEKDAQARGFSLIARKAHQMTA
jgi:tetratricopeptide (TPR) repeat protein